MLCTHLRGEEGFRICGRGGSALRWGQRPALASVEGDCWELGYCNELSSIAYAAQRRSEECTGALCGLRRGCEARAKSSCGGRWRRTRSASSHDDRGFVYTIFRRV